MGAQHVAKHGKLCKSLNHQVDLQITRATCLPNHLAGQDCIAATGRTERRLVRAMAGFDGGSAQTSLGARVADPLRVGCS